MGGRGDDSIVLVTYSGKTLLDRGVTVLYGAVRPGGNDGGTIRIRQHRSGSTRCPSGGLLDYLIR